MKRLLPVCLALAMAAIGCAAEARPLTEDERLTFSGFGTLGLIHSNQGDAGFIRALAGQGSCDGHHLQVPQPARLPGREGHGRGQVCRVHGQAAQGLAAGLDAEELGLPADRLPLRLLRAAAVGHIGQPPIALVA